MKSLDIWHALPEEFRFKDPEQPITAWRADTAGKHLVGMTSRIKRVEPHALVAGIGQAGPDQLARWVDRHTSSSDRSPFVSLTTDLRFAQLFAEQPGSTIYEVTLPAHRLVRDAHNTGTPGWAPDTEVLAIGAIEPHEITGYKVNNDDPRASELIYEDERGITRMAGFDSNFDKIPRPTTPNPHGVWEHPKTPSAN